VCFVAGMQADAPCSDGIGNGALIHRKTGFSIRTKRVL
jgi:hypothetical protein